jgi:transcriptional regulator with XRE-family HTH domain
MGEARADRLNQINVIIGAKIRHQRRRLGMSLQQAGQELGLTDQQLQKYETGDNRISAAQLPDLASALSVPIAYFFEGLSEQKRIPGNAGTGDKAPACDADP